MKRYVCLMLVGAAVPAMADVQFRARRMARNDVPFGKGQCDIRLQVDGEAEVRVRGDSIFVRTISGREVRDDGSECNEPMPGRGIRGFNYEVRDSRGDIMLVTDPERTGEAVVRIRDSRGGEGRYHFRLSWMVGGGPAYGGPPAGGPPPRYDGGPGRSSKRYTTEQAYDWCREAVRERVRRDHGMREVDFARVRLDDRPGRNDYILGEVFGRRGFAQERFQFVCSVNFDSGRVRSVDVTRTR